MKSKIGMLLTIVMLLSIAVPVFAAQTGTLTINGTVEGKNYDLYRIFDMTESTDGKRAYTINENFQGFFNESEHTLATIAEMGENPEALSQLAKELLTWAVANNVEPAREVTGTAGTTTTTVNNLDYGYYLMNPRGGSHPGEVEGVTTATMFSLGIVGSTATINVKAEYPKLDKEIVDGGKINDASIGDDIDFQLTTKVPDMTGYNKYFFLVNDQLPKGMDYKEFGSITIGGVELTASDYEVKTQVNNDGTTSLRIVFKNFLQYADKTGADIVIKYTATLNDDALLGEANKNSAWLSYPNDPNYDYNGNWGTNPDPDDPFKPLDPEDPDTPGEPGKPWDPDKPVPGDETPPSITETYTTSLTVNKTDGEDPLAGADFELKNAAGEVIAYLGDNSGLTLTEFVFNGLGAGTYTLSEIATPDGYNTIDPITITINFNKTTKVFTVTTDRDTEDAAAVTDNLISMDVVNMSGPTLPETGGIGTTIFYILGTVLVLGAGVLLVVKRRMNYEA